MTKLVPHECVEILFGCTLLGPPNHQTQSDSVGWRTCSQAKAHREATKNFLAANFSVLRAKITPASPWLLSLYPLLLPAAHLTVCFWRRRAPLSLSTSPGAAGNLFGNEVVNENPGEGARERERVREKYEGRRVLGSAQCSSGRLHSTSAPGSLACRRRDEKPREETISKSRKEAVKKFKMVYH